VGWEAAWQPSNFEGDERLAMGCDEQVAHEQQDAAQGGLALPLAARRAATML